MVVVGLMSVDVVEFVTKVVVVVVVVGVVVVVEVVIDIGRGGGFDECGYGWICDRCGGGGGGGCHGRSWVCGGMC